MLSQNRQKIGHIPWKTPAVSLNTWAMTMANWIHSIHPSMRHGCYISENETTLFHSAQGRPGTKEAERYLLMGCYSSRGGGGGYIVQSQVLHFHVLVFPINIQKCLVITRPGIIYMHECRCGPKTQWKSLKFWLIYSSLFVMFMLFAYFQVFGVTQLYRSK